MSCSRWGQITSSSPTRKTSPRVSWEITGGNGARIIFDPVGGPGVEALAKAAAPMAQIFLYGALASAPTPLPLFIALSKHLTFKGYTLFEVVSDAALRTQAEKYIYDHIVAGDFKPRIGPHLPAGADRRGAPLHGVQRADRQDRGHGVARLLAPFFSGETSGFT